MKKILWIKQKQVSNSLPTLDDDLFLEEDGFVDMGEILVTDAPMQAEFTGILDNYGNKIYSMPYRNKIGFDLS